MPSARTFFRVVYSNETGNGGNNSSDANDGNYFFHLTYINLKEKTDRSKALNICFGYDLPFINTGIAAGKVREYFIFVLRDAFPFAYRVPG